uniref:MOR2-PAG1_C domain-containing protein n=1 Tax=Macrostomum lignano TaxID=282301 RepID=A0A1I8I0W4_9PLAT
VVDLLCRPSFYQSRSSVDAATAAESAQQFRQNFCNNGGLNWLLTLFAGNKVDWISDKGQLSDWGVECLAFLLEVIYQFVVDADNSSSSADNPTAAQVDARVDEDAEPTAAGSASAGAADALGKSRQPSAGGSRAKRARRSHHSASAVETTTTGETTSSSSTATSTSPSSTTGSVVFLPLKRHLLVQAASSTTNNSSSIENLARTLMDIAARAAGATLLTPLSSGRVGLIRWSLTFLLSLAFSCREEIEPVLTASDSLCGWLQATVLDCLDGQTRREVVHKIVQLCSLRSTRGVSCRQFAQPLLVCLLRFLPKAAAMRPAAEARVFGAGASGSGGASVACGAGTSSGGGVGIGASVDSKVGFFNQLCLKVMCLHSVF